MAQMQTVDIVIVGGGPSGAAAALSLARVVPGHDRGGEDGPESDASQPAAAGPAGDHRGGIVRRRF